MNNLPFFSMFKAPKNLKVLNGKEIELKEEKSFVIPSYVTRLNDSLFYRSKFTSISFVTTSLKELPERLFYENQMITRKKNTKWNNKNNILMF